MGVYGNPTIDEHPLNSEVHLLCECVYAAVPSPVFITMSWIAWIWSF